MYTLLCLGDSYTVGEGVPLYENFPYQTVQLLRAAGKEFHAPEILARTGWTTDELSAQMTGTRLLNGYDFATLLIGVNNQYRGRNSTEYAVQFEQLLQRAIGLVKPDGRVFVLSIPDWSVTPFAASTGKDRERIASAIDEFNKAAEKIAGRYGVRFIDITEHTRSSSRSADPAQGPSPFAADGLHPSENEYRAWAHLLAEAINKYC
ncbi:MAG TPA: SGNH/GDSL hydrolase family protein [Puia sp.]|nr:SGNH/GDSL hydrolase family protein [Puia sp.]